MENLYKLDAYRYSEKKGNYALKYMYYFRKANDTSNKIIQLFCRYKMNRIRKYSHLEIPYTVKIGGGLYLGHAYNITINAKAVIGKNVNIHKGVTIGQENRGARQGAPTIGDFVWIGINAAIVGKIKIGNDVLIAPNAYVNCDVPDHSIVIGNPCIIKHKENATKGYINRSV